MRGLRRERDRAGQFGLRGNPADGGYLGAEEGFQRANPEIERASHGLYRADKSRPTNVPPDEQDTAEYVCLR